jgi:cytochrome oxidase Cu insertion factor (SCO1/SenC/PrrC family)
MYRQRAPRSPAQRLAFAFAAVLVLALGYWAGNLTRDPASDVPRRPEAMVAPAAPLRVTELGLVDQYDRPFDAARAAGRWSAAVFAAPDDAAAAREALTRLVHVHNWLADRHDVQTKFQGLFVSLRPGTGQGATLRDLVGFYSPDFLGLAGDAAALQPLVPPWATAGARQGADDDAVPPLTVAVVAPDGALRGWFTPETPPATIARDIKALALGDAAH